MSEDFVDLIQQIVYYYMQYTLEFANITIQYKY